MKFLYTHTIELIVFFSGCSSAGNEATERWGSGSRSWSLQPPRFSFLELHEGSSLHGCSANPQYVQRGSGFRSGDAWTSHRIRKIGAHHRDGVNYIRFWLHMILFVDRYGCTFISPNNPEFLEILSSSSSAYLSGWRNYFQWKFPSEDNRAVKEDYAEICIMKKLIYREM